MRRRSTGSPAFRYGIRFGILLGLVQIAVSLLTNYSSVGPWASTLSLVGLVVAVLIYLLAGVLGILFSLVLGLLLGALGGLIGRELFRPASIATRVPPNEELRSEDTLSPPPQGTDTTLPRP